MSAQREFGVRMQDLIGHGVPPAGSGQYFNELRHCLIEYSVADATPGGKRSFVAE
jgi:hypothetical protein